MKHSNYSAVLLAAGASVRMQRPKLLLPFDESRSFLQKCVQELENFGCQKIIVVVNSESDQLIKKSGILFSEKVIIKVNPHPEIGRFSSIQLGMNELPEYDAVFLHDVDNPFINQSVLQELASKLESDFIHPIYNDKGGHPVLLSKNVIQTILDASSNKLDFKEILSQFKKQTIEVKDPKIIANINSPEDYHFWFGSKL